MPSEPFAELHPAFSSSGATATPWRDVVAVLEQAEIFWIATIRADGRPHVTPLPAMWLDGTGLDEQMAATSHATRTASSPPGKRVSGHDASRAQTAAASGAWPTQTKTGATGANWIAVEGEITVTAKPQGPVPCATAVSCDKRKSRCARCELRVFLAGLTECCVRWHDSPTPDPTTRPRRGMPWVTLLNVRRHQPRD
jgi:Pyridoxamine 5'-phosphate oxidase